MSLLWRLFFHEDEPWHDSCVAHDYEYWNGGTWIDRLVADARLAQGVEKTGHPLWGILMFLAVRVGGSVFIPFMWRWGYKYPFGRGYDK